MDEPTARRQRLADLLGTRGITDARVLDAIRAVPRHLFVPEALVDDAYEDRPLPIDQGQTISQPWIVAFMCQAAEIGTDQRVLEVGTGSGYAAAVTARLCAHLDSIERHAPLAATAVQRLAAIGTTNVDVHVADGTGGLPSRAPFDAIIVTAGGPVVPPALLLQLAPAGRLVMPVGDRKHQKLVRVRRTPGGFVHEELGDVRFVPLIGRAGWPGGLPDGLPFLE